MPRKNPDEISLTRLYDASVKAVWEAWTDTKQVAQWWGPRGFTITTHSKDLRPGGSWHYTMHGPDGTDYENTTTYLEVDAGKRLVYDHGGHRDRPPLFRVTVVFSEHKGQTKMEMTMRFSSADAAKESRKVIKQANGNSTWDRLAEQLSTKEIFVINRTFETPIKHMFELWTKPEHFSKWLPPTGFEMSILEGQIGEGRSVFYKMSNDDVTMYGRINYETLQAPDRIAYTQEFCDAKGGPGKHPMLPTWPALMQTTITLAAEDADTTRVTVSWQPKNATPEEIAVFTQIRPGMTQGWTGSFDKLEALLTALPAL